jgi:alpha-N-arabinofuranosidase
LQDGTTSAWSSVGNATLALSTTSPLSSALPNSLQVTSTVSGTAGISNPGWWGIETKAGNKYTGSFYAKGGFKGVFTASLVSDITDEVLASVKVKSKCTAGSWTKHEFDMKPWKSAANTNNSFVLSYEAPAGTVLNFNLVSLFPPTYKNR